MACLGNWDHLAKCCSIIYFFQRFILIAWRSSLRGTIVLLILHYILLVYLARYYTWKGVLHFCSWEQLCFLCRWLLQFIPLEFPKLVTFYSILIKIKKHQLLRDYPSTNNRYNDSWFFLLFLNMQYTLYLHHFPSLSSPYSDALMIYFTWLFFLFWIGPFENVPETLLSLAIENV